MEKQTQKRNILVPTDLTEESLTALNIATKLGKKLLWDVNLVNFTKHPLGRTFSPAGDVESTDEEEKILYNIELVKTNQEKLKNIAGKYEQEGVEVIPAIEDLHFPDEIAAFITQNNIGLIVMQTSGESSLVEEFTGNNSEQTIDNVQCPILVVRNEYSEKDFENIVFAFDWDERNDLIQLRFVEHLINAFGSKVNMHITTSDDSLSETEVKTTMDNIAERLGISLFAFTISTDRNVAESIMDYAKENNAGLIITTKDEDQGLLKIITSTKTEELVHDAETPVLFLNNISER